MYLNQTINSAEVNSSYCDQTNTNDATENDVMKIGNQIQNMAERMENLFKSSSRINNTGKWDSGLAQKKHIFNVEDSACWIHKTESHPIQQCNSVINASHEDKLRFLRQNGACFNCLKQGHIAASCITANQCDKLNHLRQRCGKRHHPYLHLDQLPAKDLTARNSIHISNNKKKENLLAVSHIRCNDGKLALAPLGSG